MEWALLGSGDVAARDLCRSWGLGSRVSGFFVGQVRSGFRCKDIITKTKRKVAWGDVLCVEQKGNAEHHGEGLEELSGGWDPWCEAELGRVVVRGVTA